MQIYDITDYLKRKMKGRDQYIRLCQIEIESNYSSNSLNNYEIEMLDADEAVKKNMRILIMGKAAVGFENRFINYENNQDTIEQYKKFKVMIDYDSYVDFTDLDTFAEAYPIIDDIRSLWAYHRITIHQN